MSPLIIAHANKLRFEKLSVLLIVSKILHCDPFLYKVWGFLKHTILLGKLRVQVVKVLIQPYTVTVLLHLK